MKVTISFELDDDKQSAKELMDSINNLVTDKDGASILVDSHTSGNKTSRQLDDKTVRETLIELGVPAYNTGFWYIVDSLVEVSKDKRILNSITKRLYPELAEKYGVSSYAVERAMRYTIKMYATKTEDHVRDKIFEGVYKNTSNRISNFVFLKVMYEYLNEVIA